MSDDLNARVASLRTGVAALRRDLPAIEWRTGQILGLLAELADVVGELATGGGAPAVAGVAPGVAGKPAVEDRRTQLDRLSWMACRALPEGLEGVRRDAEICRMLEQWGVSRDELVALGYARAEVLVTPAARRSKAASVR
jgi:hypothetical protein